MKKLPFAGQLLAMAILVGCAGQQAPALQATSTTQAKLSPTVEVAQQTATQPASDSRLSDTPPPTRTNEPPTPTSVVIPPTPTTKPADPTPNPPTTTPLSSPTAVVPSSTTVPAAGNFQASAWVAVPSPAKNSTQTVYAKLTKDGSPVSGAQAYVIAHYKTTDSRWPASGTMATGSDGTAAISFKIGSATTGYRVNVDVYITYGGQTYRTSTSFTP